MNSTNDCNYSEGQPVAVPNPNIIKFENATVNDPANIFGAITLDHTLPRRPGYGTAGKAVTLRTNHFNLSLKNRQQLVYRYDVHIEPSGGVTRKRARRYLELLLEQVMFKEVYAATDYRSMLITNSKLPLNNNEMSFKIIYHDKVEAAFPAAVAAEDPKRKNERTFRTRTLKIRHSTTYPIAELYSYVNAQQHGAKYAEKGDLIQVLNIIFCREANLQSAIANIGQNKFFPFSHYMGTHPNTESINLGNGLIASRGYFSSVRPAPQRILVNLNVSSRAFYQPGIMSNLMDMFMQNRNRSDPRSLLELSAFIKGLTVCTQYTKETDFNGVEQKVRKVKSVLGLATSPKLGANCLDITLSWTTKSGSSVKSNLEQYFKQSLFSSWLI
jgi:eukaryotic translation initiation factor 2C